MSVRGILGKKIGTTQIVRDDGASECATAIQVGPCTVTQLKTHQNEGYESVQLGYEPVKRLNKPEQGHLKKAGMLFRHLLEVGVDDPTEIEVGQQVDAGDAHRPRARLGDVGPGRVDLTRQAEQH